MRGIDSIFQRILAGLGLIALIVAVATIIVIQPFADFLPSTYVVVGGFGGLAFILGLWMARNRYRGGLAETRVIDVEYPVATPAPGYDIDRKLYQLIQYREGTLEIKDEIQERVAEVAISVIRKRENCTREDAISELEEGSWTDDEVAASFFTGGTPPKRSLSERLLGDDSSPYQRWVDRTVDAIIERAEVDPDSGRRLITRTEEDSGLFSKLGLSSSASSTEGGYGANYSGNPYEDAELVSEGMLYNEEIDTGRWRGITAFALVPAGVGVITYSPALLLLSVVGIGIAAYARMGTAPTLTDLEIERTVSDDQPEPGQPIEVTVTVHNTGNSFLSDLRVVDRLPEAARAIEGSPRIATALRPGSSTTFSYTAVTERGTHEWPVQVMGRDLSGSVEQEALIQTDTTVKCLPSLKTVSQMAVRSQTSLYSGQVGTAMGGSGLEFFAVREYRQGDPMKRIDWKRHARTGELATIDFKLERAAKIVLLFDARESAFVSPSPKEQHGLDRSVSAAVEIFASLYDEGNLVGVAAYDTVPCWLGPSAGDAHRERARQLFANHSALSPIPPALKEAEGHYVDPMTHVRRQLSPDTQVMLFSPLCDDYTAKVARQLDSSGHSVTIVSPDPTVSRTIGQRLARVERAMRVATLRERGVRVVDWNYDEQFGMVLNRAEKRWVA